MRYASGVKLDTITDYCYDVRANTRKAIGGLKNQLARLRIEMGTVLDGLHQHLQRILACIRA